MDYIQLLQLCSYCKNVTFNLKGESGKNPALNSNCHIHQLFLDSAATQKALGKEE